MNISPVFQFFNEDKKVFPKFLLKRMYDKNSLKTTGEGFSFTIRNSIANGNVVEVFLLALNNEEIPFTDITIENETQKMSADIISTDNPVELRKGVTTTFSVKKNNLTELVNKEVKIHMKFKVQVRDSKMTIDFDFDDTLKE